MNKLRTEQNKHIFLKDITSHGSHISRIQSIKGRVLSLLHCSPNYVQTNLHMRYVEWAQQPGSLNEYEYKSYEFSNFFAAMKSLKTQNPENFNNANSRHIARILDTFSKHQGKLQSIFSSYYSLASNSKEFDIDAFIAVTKKAFIEEGKNKFDLTSIKSALNDQLFKATQFSPKLKNTMIDTIIWELALDLVKISVGPFAGASASLILVLASPAFKHIYEKKTIYGTIEAITNSWNQRILDDNSFHPLVEIIIRALWIRTTWSYIDQLPNIAKTATILHTMISYGIVNFVLKYSTLNAFSTLKAELHKGSTYATALYNAIEAAILGAIRGLNRNCLTPFTSWNGWDFLTSSISLFSALLTMQGLKNPSTTFKTIYERGNILSIIVIFVAIFSYNAQAIQHYFTSTTSSHN